MVVFAKANIKVSSSSVDWELGDEVKLLLLVTTLLSSGA